MTPLQTWGMPLIALLPVLAVVDLIGTAEEQVVAEADGVRLEVSYPRRSHRDVTTPLTVTVSNLRGSALEDVYVLVPRDYVERFDEFELRPSAEWVSADSFRLSLGSVPPGESRVATALLTPGDYGRVSGSVQVGSGGEAPLVNAEFATVTFP